MTLSAPPSILDHQHRISAQAFLEERQAVETLLEMASPLRDLAPSYRPHARRLIEAMRAPGAVEGMEAFLQEYRLGTQEGASLMCLAEALLRIPDAATADRLVHDTFAQGEWEKYLGQSSSLFVNASGWGLLLTGKIIQWQDNPSSLLARLIGRMGEPLLRQALKKAMEILGGQFVLGETIESALRRAHAAERKGYRHSYDMLGEGARSEAQARHYLELYHHAIRQLREHAANIALFEAPNLSVKLSALHPRYNLTQADRVMEELAPRVIGLLSAAREEGITVSLDAEEATRLDIQMQLFAHLLSRPELAGWNGVGFVVQAYQRRAFALIDWLAGLARESGRIIPLRLVKGAYWDAEIKSAQVNGLPSYPVFTRKEYTDLSYLACASKMLRATDCFFPQFATHNALTAAQILSLAEHHGIRKEAYEFQRLHGMGELLHDQLLAQAGSRIYAPVGRHKELLGYLIRRLLENGANTSFVHLLTDQHVPIDALLEDPLEYAEQYLGTPSPLPSPLMLYGEMRRNSAGLDLGNLAMLESLENSLAAYREAIWHAAPLIAAHTEMETPRDCHEPARFDVRIGTVRETTPQGLNVALDAARKGAELWNATPVEARASILEAIADALEANVAEFIALCAREAGRTVGDGIAEVREAADFCRYYAQQARHILPSPEALPGPTGESNRLTLHPRGVFACISPWNFPLAIFTGQIAAALAAGNAVIAKPAGQTPLIAYRAIQAMHAAGIPPATLQLLPGGGSSIGAALVADPRIDGVVFTGSMDTARRIHRALAQREGSIAPLIAETGGRNCMVVDSSALLEQAADDILLSAFGSAGQRCSALTALYIQEEIFEELTNLLAGAMCELRPGHPLLPSTDLGPVIDRAAQARIQAHIAAMQESARLIAALALPPELEQQGCYVAPHIFEIEHIGQIKEEVFGPVLHVMRFSSTELDQVIEQINRTGYGLTFGIHSRVPQTIERFTSQVRAGNCYVNRSMIGATVGVQPFGGEGLSGTGPKAGGPHYLLRFLTERTLSINTAAIGGNLSLLSESWQEKK